MNLNPNDLTLATPVEDLQVRVIEIWSSVLNMPADAIELDDDFFSLGGESYRAAQLLSRLNGEYGIQLELIDLFDWSDVEGFTALVQSKLQDAARRPSGPRIVRVDRRGPMAASSMQKRMWFLEQVTRDETDAYSLGTVLWLRGSLDKSALQRAFSTIVERHENLRTVVYMDDDGEILQRIEPATTVALPVIALAVAEVESFKCRFCGERLDIAAAPLIRTALLMLGEGRYVLLFRVHDVAYDGWSASILVHELNVLYRAYCLDETNPLVPLEIQYADYSDWKSQRVRPDELERQLRYWQKQLAGSPELLDLPTDHPRSGAQRFRGAHLGRTLPATLLRDLRELGREERATLFTTLTAAFNVLLWRWSGNQDIPIGTLVFDRVMPGVEKLIGAFLDTIVLRTKLEPAMSFRELLRRVDEVARAAYENQDVAFEQIVETVRQKRNRAHTPLFQVMIAMQNAPNESLQLWNLEVENVEWISPGARFDLLLRTAELPEGLGVSMEYNSDLFEEVTIGNLLDRWRCLLEQIVQSPDRPLGTLPVEP